MYDGKSGCYIVGLADAYAIHNNYDGCTIYSKDDKKIEYYISFFEKMNKAEDVSVSQMIINYMKSDSSQFKYEYPYEDDVQDLKDTIDSEGPSYIYELATRKSREYTQDQCGSASMYWHKIAKLIPILYGSMLEKETSKLVKELINELNDSILCSHVKESDSYKMLLSKIAIGQL